MASMARMGSVLPRCKNLVRSISSSAPFSVSKEASFLSIKPRYDYDLKCHVHSSTKPKLTSELKDENNASNNSWKIKMLYDGDCPLCMREVNMLRERNKEYGAIKFVDISSKDYCPNENQDLDYETVMGRIHAILSDGTIVTDLEAFKRLYEEVGLGWVYAITKYEPVAKIANAVYGVWAKYRLQLTGRPPLEVVLENRRKLEEGCKDDKACKM